MGQEESNPTSTKLIRGTVSGEPVCTIGTNQLEACTNDCPGRALLSSTSQCHRGVFALLVRTVDPSRLFENCPSVLNIAAYKCDYEISKILLEAGSTIDQCDGSVSALHTALVHGSKEVVALLLRHGADVHTYNPLAEATSCLHIVLDIGYYEDPKRYGELLQLLLDFGADVDRKDTNGETALHLACYCQEGSDAVRCLLAAHADVNARNHKGYTPLFSALAMRNEKEPDEELMNPKSLDQMLREDRVDLNMQYEQGRSVLALTVSFDRSMFSSDLALWYTKLVTEKLLLCDRFVIDPYSKGPSGLERILDRTVANNSSSQSFVLERTRCHDAHIRPILRRTYNLALRCLLKNMESLE